MTYVGYYRVSTKKQSKSGLGLDAQQQAVRDFAASRGGLIDEFIEVESGRNDQRHELAKAIATARRAKAGLLIARLDRFSRRVSFIATMMEKGVPLTVVEMPYATDFQLHIFAALAQEERRLISERTKAALAQAKQRGKVLGRHGVVLAAQNRDDARTFAAGLLPSLPEDWQGMSHSSLARYLNAKGLCTPRRKRFHPQSAKNLKKVLAELEPGQSSVTS